MATQTEVLQKLVRLIRTGLWSPGDKLPSVRELATQFASSPATLTYVLAELARRGYVERHARRGVFVLPKDRWDIRCGGGTQKLVGVMLSEVVSMLPTIEEQLRRFGYSMLVRHASGDLDAALVGIEEWRAQGVHGIIWSPLSTPEHTEANERLADAIAASGVPAVAVDRYPQTREVNCVLSDNAQAAYTLTRHLLEMGHRRIGLLRHRHGSTPADRHAGYNRALAQHGIAEEDSLICTVAHDLPVPMLIETLRTWLRDTRPTAAWSITGDPLGQALLMAAQLEGLNVPEDLSVATFDSLIAPFSVTSIIQPLEAMATRAVQFLLEQIKTPSPEIHRMILPSRLEEGASCVPPANFRRSIAIESD